MRGNWSVAVALAGILVSYSHCIIFCISSSYAISRSSSFWWDMRPCRLLYAYLCTSVHGVTLWLTWWSFSSIVSSDLYPAFSGSLTENPSKGRNNIMSNSIAYRTNTLWISSPVFVSTPDNHFTYFSAANNHFRKLNFCRSRCEYITSHIALHLLDSVLPRIWEDLITAAEFVSSLDLHGLKQCKLRLHRTFYHIRKSAFLFQGSRV